MNGRFIACRVGCGLAAMLAAAHLTSTIGSGEPQDSVLYQNFVRASEVLDRAVAAHGGEKLLDRGMNVRIAFTGTLISEGHFARPWAQLQYPLEGSLIYSAGLRAVKSEVTQLESGERFPSFTIVGPSNGLALRTGKTQTEPIPEADLEERMRKELEILPQEYLRQARAGIAGLRLLNGIKGREVISYSLDNGEGRALIFDAKTHLLLRVERIDHWEHKGDRLEWRTFADYVPRNGIQIPLRSESHTEGSSYQINVRSEITKAEFGSTVGPDELSVPAASRDASAGWTLQPPVANDTDELLPSHELGKGVYIIELPSSTSRSLLVAFSDFAVIVEAGDHSEISAKLLATADHLLPDKPVRYVATSHHHPLYANGLRPYAQRGVTILATEGNVAYYRDLTTRPYRIHPDAQQRNPREPKIESIAGTRVIEQGGQRLELHVFGTSTHVDEFALAYLPSQKLIVTGDLVYVLRDAELRPANARERAVDRFVKEQKLDVERIMQTWFVAESEHLVPYSTLEAKIRLAEAKETP